MKKKIMRNDNTCAWSGDIKPTGSAAGNLGAAVIKAIAECADMTGAEMNNAKMIGAKMIGAKMIGAGMNGAGMNGAVISGANFHCADMRFVSRDDDAKIARLDVCEWPVTIQDTGIYIGCKVYTLEEIMSMTEEKANGEHPAAGIRWRRWGKALKELAQATLVNNKPEPEVRPKPEAPAPSKPKRTRKSK